MIKQQLILKTYQAQHIILFSHSSNDGVCGISHHPLSFELQIKLCYVNVLKLEGLHIILVKSACFVFGFSTGWITRVILRVFCIDVLRLKSSVFTLQSAPLAAIFAKVF